MVDTPEKTNNDNKEDPVEDKPPERQPKRQLPRCRSKSRHSKDCSTVTGKNNTPDDAKNNEDPVKVTSEQGERENGQVSADEQAIHGDSEDSNYLPLSEEEESLGNEDFIVPEEPLEQERFKRRLIATSRSRERSSCSFKRTKICSMIDGPKSWPPKNMALVAQPKASRSVDCYLSSMTKR